MFNTEVTDLVEDSSTPSSPKGRLNFIKFGQSAVGNLLLSLFLPSFCVTCPVLQRVIAEPA